MSTQGQVPEPAVSNAPPSAPLPETTRIISTFTDPSKTFADLKRSSRWFFPWLIISLFSYALIFAAAQKIGFEQISENQMKMNRKQAERIESLPPEQQQGARELTVKITKVISYSVPAIFLLVVLVIAAVLMATFNFGFGEQIPFATCMAVVMYANLPGVIKAVLAIVSIYAGASPESFIFQNPLASNFGNLVDITAHPALYSLASAVDLFSIWIVVLTGIGFACVSKLKRSTAMGVVLAWYAVVTLVGAGFAAIFA